MDTTVPFSTTELTRYSRHFSLQNFGIACQTLLKKSRILCIGAGGLSCPALYYLAAAGIGTLGISDGDMVELSNLQRQILFSVDDIGNNKALSAQEKLNRLNPDILINTYPFAITADNVFEIIKNYDVVLDGSDNYATRYLINDACFFLKKPLVFASIFQFEGQCSVFNTEQAPCYRCLYREPPPAGLIPNCAEGGVLGILPGILGTLQATEALKLMTGIGVPLAGRLLVYHALKMEFREFEIKAQPDCLLCGLKTPFDKLPRYSPACTTNNGESADLAISVFELKNLLAEKQVFLLDVREPYEYEICHLKNALLIPLNQLPHRITELEKETPIVVYCKSDARSKKAVTVLEAAGFHQATYLKGGILAWAKDIEPSLQTY